jgi:large subunit ribosomal protein L25
MNSVSLATQKREQGISPRILRAQGFIPIEFYGFGVQNLSLQVEYQTFRKVYQKAGESTLIDLNVEGDKGRSFNVLVHDVQHDPLSGSITHIDLVNVRMDKEVHTHLPLEFVGESPAK